MSFSWKGFSFVLVSILSPFFTAIPCHTCVEAVLPTEIAVLHNKILQLHELSLVHTLKYSNLRSTVSLNHKMLHNVCV